MKIDHDIGHQILNRRSVTHEELKERRKKERKKEKEKKKGRKERIY